MEKFRKRNRVIATVLVLSLSAMTVPLVSIPPASAALGDFVGTANFSMDCESGIGVGIAFDGANLWYSCFEYGSEASGIDLLRALPNGTVTATYNIVSNGGLGALSYDATRNAIWAGEGGWIYGGGPGPLVRRIDLNMTKDVVGSTVVFNTNDTCGLDDGLAFDARTLADSTDDVIYYSDDCSTTTIDVFALNGTNVESFAWGGSSCYNSGLAVGGVLLYQGSDGCSRVWVVNKNTKAAAFDFTTVVSGDPNFRDEDLECDTNTFAGQGKHVMWSKEAYSSMRAHAFEIAFGSCGIGGVPSGPGVTVSKFFTDTSYNPLPKDANGNPKVDVVLANGVVRSTNPGQIMAWVNVTNTGATPIQSLKVNETLPMDWTAHPDWLPAKGAIHVFFATNPTTLPPSLEITQPSTITLIPGNPEAVTLAIPSLNATAAGQPLMPGQSVLLQVKLDHILAGSSQSASSYPRNATDTACAIVYAGANYTGSSSSDCFTGLFVAYAKVVGDASGDNKVNVVDLALTGKAFGSRAGSARFNANADFDYNGIIDITDLATVGLYFGTSS